MGIWRSRLVFVGLCTVFMGTIAASTSIYAGDESVFKRIKVEKRPLGSRINIQIKPDESYYHKDKPEPQKTVPIIDGTKTAIKPVGQYEWFWSGFDHDISNASLARLIDAEEKLSQTPQKSGNIAPSLESMRKLVKSYGPQIMVATLDKKISPAFVLAVIGVESAGRVDVVSSAGAVGLMQLIPETAKRFNVNDSTDPKQNISGGAAYLDWLLKEFQSDPILALAGYNAGENAVKKHKGVPPFAETRGYVPKVVAAWKVAKALCKTPPKYATDGCVFDLSPKN
ncbi:lytic transglycosylase domain-containing protein [Amylibacter sp. SFDW26]|uniref:lytic transglycosylase domain-containing protein n=1 Tax=Amylibacter sp. SFDW26 TaxID=2652722 RepID=UPI0012617E1E|nr:lytic transglycosylase domain-containing protein [Amylibacter sp. SFDW26]KAB7613476.1 lytic transglycosylase domain-containing protein [Amylibacter sp. SFDW26]